ncbi:myosin light chain kinase A-like [Watersipora subatra]|uniref:myosin light chain kinase A-like n=1 Tax=Watersipora subatra TaxID=2589382 RepID=UPI00355B2B30
MSSADTASTLPSSNVSSKSSNDPTPDSVQSQSSTFDTQPLSTQEDLDIPGDAWGQLSVIGGITYDLVDKLYIVGRAAGSNIQLTTKMEPIRKYSLYKSCSKSQFKIYIEARSAGSFIFIEDLSTNGTIVNNDMMGKGKFSVLKNGDVISLVKKEFKAFLFTECNAKEKNDGFPLEVRSKYMFIEDLGKGAFGTVKLAIRRSDKLRVACKCIPKTDKLASTQNSQDLMKEVEIMKKLDHPCIIKVVHVVDTEPMLFLFMDLVEGGDLLTAIKRLRRLDAADTQNIFYQTCLAVQYLHKNNVVHRDLKPENILLTSMATDRQIVKVTDFGYSIITATSSLLQTICGTSLYLAPELVNMAVFGAGELDNSSTQVGYTKAVDCWSLGVILYVCTTGQPAFTPQRKDMPLHTQILTGSYKLKDCYWEYLDDAKDLVGKLMTVDPKQRITLDDALEHPYFKDDQLVQSVHRLLSEEQGFPFERNACEPDDRPAKKARRDDVMDEGSHTNCITPLLSHDEETILNEDASMPETGLPGCASSADMDTTSAAGKNSYMSTSSNP